MTVSACKEQTCVVSKPRYFIIDSGASVNLIAECNLTAEEKARKRLLRVPLILSTASGKTEAKYCVEVYIPALRMSLTFCILKDTPSARHSAQSGSESAAKSSGVRG